MVIDGQAVLQTTTHSSQFLRGANSIRENDWGLVNPTASKALAAAVLTAKESHTV